MIAIIEIYRGTRRRDGSLPFHTAPIDASTVYLEQFVRAFQERGEFRDFDPRVMAYAIRSAIDAIPQQLAKGLELDL
jgi:TetR/AcrR family transcriptional regulator, fatty acid metabolism regulator protein